MSSANYQGPQGINPFASSISSTNYGSGGITPFVRGVKQASGSGGSGYSGPYGESTITYTYGEDEAGPHAVSSRDIPNTSNDDSFTYDANGNMTQRIQGGVTWTQTFDNENRLVSVSNGTTTTTYVYDGSGARIKRITGNTTTIYVASMEIETQTGVSGSKKTVYYPAGAFRVIDTLNGEDENDLYYRHSDHLGSTSVVSDWQGIKVADSEVVYAPFGEVRDGPESDLTDFGYTGQRHDDSTGGLMYYNARYYLPGVMRFISADTIVRGVGSQVLNRYSYVLNSPIMFNDPSGHFLQPTIEGVITKSFYNANKGNDAKINSQLGYGAGGNTSFTGETIVLPGSGRAGEKTLFDIIVQSAKSGRGPKHVVMGSEADIKEVIGQHPYSGNFYPGSGGGGGSAGFGGTDPITGDFASSPGPGVCDNFWFCYPNGDWFEGASIEETFGALSLLTPETFTLSIGWIGIPVPLIGMLPIGVHYSFTFDPYGNLFVGRHWDIGTPGLIAQGMGTWALTDRDLTEYEISQMSTGNTVSGSGGFIFGGGVQTSSLHDSPVTLQAGLTSPGASVSPLGHSWWELKNSFSK